MEETIILLREQTIFCSRLLKLFADLTESLKKNSLTMIEVVNQIEIAVAELSKNSIRSQTFLERLKFKNFNEFINSQPDGVKKDVATRLLKHNSDLQSKLQIQMKILKRLNDNGKNFVNFNLNVLSRTSAAPTYGAEAVTETHSKRRLFDTNV
jgi:Mg2+ and Co2+ transporter CorA